MGSSILQNNFQPLEKGKESNLSITLKKLKLYEEIVENSVIFRESVDALKSLPFSHIRCLALGSPTESIPSLYQLAYLNKIRQYLEVGEPSISLYDPIFTDIDVHLLTGILRFEVGENFDNPGEKTLFFLPHASLELTEQVLAESQPLWLLGNDITAHSIRLPKLKLHEKYRTVSLLANLLEKNSNAEKKSVQYDGFEEPMTKTRRRKHRQQQPVPVINFDYSGCYFSSASMKPLTDTEGPWGNAFSSLSLHLLS